MGSSWDVPAPQEHGDLDEEVLFTEIGRALTEWEQVEGACAELFAVLVSAPKKASHRAPAIRAWGAVTGFNARCEMLKVAAAAYFRTRKQKRLAFENRFKLLITECLGFAGRRNEIAHGRVSIVYYYKRTQGRKIGHFLLPSIYNPKKYNIKQSAAYVYTSKDVIHFRQEFTKLQWKLDAFRKLLNERTQPTKPGLIRRLPPLG